MLVAGLFSLLAWVVLQRLAPPAFVPWTQEMEEAAHTMEAALRATRAYCEGQGIAMDPLEDPAETCLVGPQLTSLFTTLGQPEAKRTTLNPDLAALLVHLLREAGVEGGDTVAMGASGSFPGLLVASLAAAEALKAVPVPILSLGASSFGATRPEFHLLDLHLLLNREGIINTPPAAVSLGGGGDMGKEFPEPLRDSLTQEVRALNIPLAMEEDLRANVSLRMALYGTPLAFMNLGGSQANLGTSPAVLTVPPGLNVDLGTRVTIPPADQRGVIFEMADRGIPVIHLLHIRGLALKHGLPWDPQIFPSPGTTRILTGAPSRGTILWIMTGVYLLGLAFILVPPFFGRHTVR